MFAKVLSVVLALGATGGMLLVIRQQRLETAHELSAAHQRLSEGRRCLWTLRIEVAGACGPDRLRLEMAELGGGWTAVEPGQPVVADVSTGTALAGSILPGPAASEGKVRQRRSPESSVPG